jgi:hypothetical protein
MICWTWNSEAGVQDVLREGFSLDIEDEGGSQFGRAVYLCPDWDSVLYWQDALERFGITEALQEVEVADGNLLHVDGSDHATNEKFILAFVLKEGIATMEGGELLLTPKGEETAEAFNALCYGVYPFSGYCLRLAAEDAGYDGMIIRSPLMSEMVVWNLAVLRPTGQVLRGYQT